MIDGHVAFTSDVNGTGFCAELMRVLTPGTKIKGSIASSGRDYPFEGKVRWAQSGDARLHVVGKMGVQFATIDIAFGPSLQRDFQSSPSK